MMMTGGHHHGEFSPEDIQDLLGSVFPDAPHPGFSEHSTSDQPLPISNPTMDADAAKVAARTERKRSREKQRRSDVNKQFGELSMVLRRIDANHHPHSNGDNSSSVSVFAPGNRAELIARTIRLLETLDEANKKQKRDIQDYQVQLENAKKAGEETAAKLKEQLLAPRDIGHNRVMMMVPMMIGGNGGSSTAEAMTAATGSSTTTPHPLLTPWMMPFAAAASSDPQPRSASAPPPAATAATTTTMAPWMMPFLPPPPFVSAFTSSSEEGDSQQQQKPASTVTTTATTTATATNLTIHTNTTGPTKESPSASSSSSDSTDHNNNLAHCA